MGGERVAQLLGPGGVADEQPLAVVGRPSGAPASANATSPVAEVGERPLLGLELDPLLR